MDEIFNCRFLIEIFNILRFELDQSKDLNFPYHALVKNLQKIELNYWKIEFERLKSKGKSVLNSTSTADFS